MARSEEEEDHVEFRILDFGGGYWKNTSVFGVLAHRRPSFDPWHHLVTGIIQTLPSMTPKQEQTIAIWVWKLKHSGMSKLECCGLTYWVDLVWVGYMTSLTPVE